MPTYATQAALSAEITARAQADKNEASIRAAAVTAEGQARLAADAALGTLVSTLEASMANVVLRLAAVEAKFTPPAPTVPGAPTSVVATAGDGQASVAFVAPSSNGGATITSYTATSTPGSHTASGASAPLVVTGLTNGTAYTFTVHATNSVGNSAESSASASVTPAALSRPFAVPTTTGTVNVSDGADVVAAVAAAPNGSIISLATNGNYTLAGPIVLDSRSNIILLGNGATLHAAAGYTEASSGIQAFGASDIAIRNLKIIGQSPTPGVQISGHEGAHGIRLVGGTRIEIDSCDISNTYGDAANTDYWTDGVWMHGCNAHGTSRCGFAVLAGKNILIEDNTFAYNAGMVLDIEPYQALGGADTVTFRNNTSTWQGASNDPSQPYRSEDWFFAANQAFGGTLGIHNISVTGNTLLHGSFKCELVLPGTGLRFTNVTLTGNTSPTAMAGPALVFAHIDGLTITGNTQPLSSGSLASITDCTGVVGP